MDYKLARSLKDAGFPQESKWNGKTRDDNNLTTGLGVFILGKEGTDAKFKIYVPTFSELIEACGYPIFVGAHHETYWYAKNGMHSEAVSAEAKTPEEAVARLYIALNKT